jgi:hypothetical protein
MSDDDEIPDCDQSILCDYEIYGCLKEFSFYEDWYEKQELVIKIPVAFFLMTDFQMLLFCL